MPFPLRRSHSFLKNLQRQLLFLDAEHLGIFLILLSRMERCDFQDSFRVFGWKLSETNVLIKARNLPVSKKNADEGKREAKRRGYKIS